MSINPNAFESGTHASRSRLLWRSVSVVLLALMLAESDLSVAAQASPVVRVLFGNDDCTFLPERPTPPWINKRPATNDYVGISSASNSDRKLSPTEQIQAAEQNARASLAAEISVTVKETVKYFVEERTGSSTEGVSRDMMTQASLEATQVVDQTLAGSRIEERYLDRHNCVVHAWAGISKAAVEEANKKLLEKLRKLFRFKNLMLLDRTEVQGEMANATRGQLDALFKQVGNKLLATDNGHLVCADDPGQPLCQEPADTIYAGYKIVLDKEATTPEFKRRIYKLIGSIRFKDRMVASFDVSCQGTGKTAQDYFIDQEASKACFKKAKPIIEKGMEGSE